MIVDHLLLRGRHLVVLRLVHHPHKARRVERRVHMILGHLVDAEAVTFPWGSIPLFGIDKVTKYHMDAPLYATSFVWVMNKAKYESMSASQKKVIDDHCTTQWAIRLAAPRADFEHAGIAKRKARGHDVYPLTSGR